MIHLVRMSCIIHLYDTGCTRWCIFFWIHCGSQHWRLKTVLVSKRMHYSKTFGHLYVQYFVTVGPQGTHWLCLDKASLAILGHSQRQIWKDTGVVGKFLCLQSREVDMLHRVTFYTPAAPVQMFCTVHACYEIKDKQHLVRPFVQYHKKFLFLQRPSMFQCFCDCGTLFL